MRETDVPSDGPPTAESVGWAGAPPRVSVVIPTHNRAPFLAELIASLEAQSLPRDDFEVAIVDDASTDGTWEELRRLASGTRVRMRASRAGQNAGPAATRNAGASLARGSLLVFTDDDCLPSSVWLEALDRAADGFDLVQGRTLPEPAPSGPWDRYVWVTGPSALFESCNLAIRRTAFDEAGGFPAERPDVHRATRHHFGEDVELGWRIKGTGRRSGYSAAALVHHRLIPSRYVEWLRECRRMGLFPGLVRTTPPLRRSLLRYGVFLSKRTAQFDLAVAGAAGAVALGRPWIALAALPWLRSRWREARGAPGLRRAVHVAQLAVGDAVGLASLLEGSVRSRRLVL